MARVDPWWFAPFDIGNPLRHWVHNAETIVGPYVQPGMKVLDVGCGLGWFSVAMARHVGEHGKVIAVDLQQQMLNMLRRRAKRAGVTDRIEMHKCDVHRLGIHAEVDFAMVFAVLHKVPDQTRLLHEVHDCLRPGGKMLLAEPPVHVTHWKFADEVVLAKEAGFQIVGQPRIRWSHAAEFVKEPEREYSRRSASADSREAVCDHFPLVEGVGEPARAPAAI
jgi:ubiquinone/menaquinone biosynthesis C-methylase UbiE